MKPGKADKLTTIALSVFNLNGLLIEWGDAFSSPYGLTSARWQVLGAIALAQSAPSAPQIAASMGVTRQGAQKQLNLLLDEGLVQAQENPAHRRSPLYALTRQGEKTYRALDKRWQQHVLSLSGDFRKSDLDAAIRVLSALSHVYSRPPESGTES